MDERTRPLRTAPLRFLASVNESVLPEATSPDFTFKYMDISQVDGNGEVSIPDDPTKFGAAPSRARRLAKPGSTVVSTVRTYLRAIAAVPTVDDQLVFSTGFAVLRPLQGDPRYFSYACRSDAFVNEIVARSVGVSYPAISPSELMGIRLPSPDITQQRRIADFLDDRVARIDQIITARNQQTARLEASLVRASFDAVRGAGQMARRESGLAWLGTIPNSWPLVTVATEFHVDLGKMLDEKRQTGASAIPYLRNTNVQWDHVDISDLKEMDIDPAERERYCVRPGDLLICEGGQPGRSAVWLGELAPLGFQKALHRARSRGRSRPRWLLECLRVAAHLNVFAVENGQTTIGHLTNEQLRSFRLPFPDPSEQDRALEYLHSRQADVRGTQAALNTGVELLQEYKQSLITAAVTGELDVTTAGSGIPGHG